MARPLRLQYPGAIYHITARGNEKRVIFRDNHDRRRFLERLAQSVKEHHIRLYAFVLMDNHYHLLAETPRANLAQFMQQLNTAYTVYFNRRHERVGHLLSGRYAARIVEGDRYLLRLTRYVHLNPVRVAAAKDLTLEEKVALLRQYQWSSYPSYIGLAPRHDWVDYGPMLALVAHGTSRAAAEYRDFVEAGLAENDTEMQQVMQRSKKAIGSDEFCRWAEGAYRDLAAQQAQVLDVGMRRMENPAPIPEILSAVCAHFGLEEKDILRRRSKSDAKLLLIKLLKEEGALTQRQIANVLGLRDGSGISRHIAECNIRLAQDRALAAAYVSIKEGVASRYRPPYDKPDQSDVENESDE